MTQFANFGALALATTGQHERWPDYAVGVHNWHLEYAKFSILHECQKFSSFTFTLLPALYGEALTIVERFFVNCLLKAVTAIIFPAPSTSNDNVTQIHEKASVELYVQSIIAKDNITRSQNPVHQNLHKLCCVDAFLLKVIM